MLHCTRIFVFAFGLLPLGLQGQTVTSYVMRNIAGTFPLGDGGLATSALLERPQAVAVDANGNMYIADVGNNVIRKVTRSGLISTVPGFTGNASDLKLDAAGNLYIAIRPLVTDRDRGVLQPAADPLNYRPTQRR